MSPDEIVLRQAEKQYALITLEQALTAGLSAHQVRARLASGRWRRRRATVFAVAGAPTSWEQAVMAACLGARVECVVSHGTAASLWGTAAGARDPIHLLSPHPYRPKIRGVVGHRTYSWFDDDLTVYRGLPVTSVARTLIDRSAKLSEDALGAALDQAERKGLTTLDRFRRCADRLSSGPGRRMRVVQAVLEQRLPGYDPGESDLESRVLRTIVELGFLPPRQQHRVQVRGRRYRIDLAYPELLVAIELDGWAPHGTDRSVFDNDRRRANELTAVGWTIVRFTSRSTVEEIRDTIDAVLAQRLARGA
jgi:very-short-patch-repair endonuclease